MKGAGSMITIFCGIPEVKGLVRIKSATVPAITYGGIPSNEEYEQEVVVATPPTSKIETLKFTQIK